MHPSHYGRMCPIETPEGPNIGLIGSLSSYGRINEFGFIETPYRRVEAGKITSKIDYLSADEEDRHVIAQANTAYDLKTGKIVGDSVLVPPQGRRGRLGAGGRGRLHGRLAEAAGLGGRRADPVPGARRREPRPDGREHAEAGRAAAALRGPARGHRRGVPRRGRRRRRGRGRGSRCRRRRLGRGDRRQGALGQPAHLQAAEVPALEPGHEHQPEAARRRRRQGGQGPGHRRRRRRPRPARSRSARTSWSPTCRGRATTTRTRSS